MENLCSLYHRLKSAICKIPQPFIPPLHSSLSISLIAIFLSGCAAVSEPAPKAAPAPAPKAAPAPAPKAEAPKAIYLNKGTVSFASKFSPAKAAESQRKVLSIAGKSKVKATSIETNRFEDIKAELAATPTITIPGPPGDLRVWIGNINLESNFPSGLTSASAVITTSVRPKTVLVVPNANAFNVEPSSKCQLFDPTGTTVNFQLTPKYERNDIYPVGARIEIFGGDNCSGDPDPKAAKDITVKVVVQIVPEEDIWKILRENISKLWAGLLALIVALMLFFARKLLKKVFGFEEKKSE